MCTPTRTYVHIWKTSYLYLQTDRGHICHTHTHSSTHQHTHCTVSQQTNMPRCWICTSASTFSPSGCLSPYFFFFTTAPLFRLPPGWKISFSVVARLEFLIMLHFTAAQKKKKIIKQNKSQKQRRAGKKIFQTHIEVALIMRKWA